MSPLQLESSPGNGISFSHDSTGSSKPTLYLFWYWVYADLPYFDCELTRHSVYVNYTQTRSVIQPVLINEGIVSSSMKQREPLLRFDPH